MHFNIPLSMGSTFIFFHNINCKLRRSSKIFTKFGESGQKSRHKSRDDVPRSNRGHLRPRRLFVDTATDLLTIVFTAVVTLDEN